MPAQLFGIEHILYIVLSILLASIFLLLSKKLAKTKKKPKHRS